MKATVLILGIFFMLVGCADMNNSAKSSSVKLKSFSEAWVYLSEKNHSERWVVISSKSKSGYLQCENLDDVVRCDIPVWTKILPTNNSPIRPFGGQEHPYPVIDGAQYKELISKENLEKAVKILKKYDLDPFYVYSQVESKNGKIVGTQSDIRFMVSFKYKNFEQLSKDYLGTLFGIKEENDFVFEIGS